MRLRYEAKRVQVWQAKLLSGNSQGVATGGGQSHLVASLGQKNLRPYLRRFAHRFAPPPTKRDPPSGLGLDPGHAPHHGPAHCASGRQPLAVGYPREISRGGCQDEVIHLTRCVGQGSRNVIRLEKLVVCQDLLPRCSRSNEIQDVTNTNAITPNTRPSSTFVWLRSDALEQIHSSSIAAQSIPTTRKGRGSETDVPDFSADQRPLRSYRYLSISRLAQRVCSFVSKQHFRRARIHCTGSVPSGMKPALAHQATMNCPVLPQPATQ